MQVWQVANGDFYSIDLHHCSIVLWIHVNITVAKQEEYMNTQIALLTSRLIFLDYLDTDMYLHVCDLHVDLVVLLCLVSLQQNDEFEFWGAVLSQHLVARVGHLILVFPLVECDDCVFVDGTLIWPG